MMRQYLTALIILSVSTHLMAIEFEQVPASAGIAMQSQTFGSSWSDVNGDDWPDLYVSNHWRLPALYLNNRDGTFTDVAHLHDLYLGHIDVHAAAFGDYNNDGDSDLLTGVGGAAADGSSPDTPLFGNELGILRLIPPAVSNLNWGHSDRTPLWFDENLDGFLDAVIASVGKSLPSALFQQLPDSTFSEVSNSVGLSNLNGASLLLLKNENTQTPSLFLNRDGTHMERHAGVWQDVTGGTFIPQQGGNDILQNDYDGDGCMDIYIVREGRRSQMIVNDGLVELNTSTDPNVVAGLDIATGGSLSFHSGLSLGPRAFRLGTSGIRVPAQDVYQPIVIDATDPAVQGAPPQLIMANRATIFVWRENNIWHIRYGATVSRAIELVITYNGTAGTITQFNTLPDLVAQNRYYQGSCSGTYQVETNDLTIISPSSSAVVEDFDNDMDLDVYLVNRNPVNNVANQLFENDGVGGFTEVPGTGGAGGTLIGSGDTASAADFDLDGKMDIFVTNGRSDLLVINYPGPHELFHNITNNGNHWVEIDLFGTSSNLDAIGATVNLTAGGKTQIRYQDGGMHTYTQDFSRIHFGLGQNAIIDQVEVIWPSGDISRHERIPGDQLIRLVEPVPEFKPGLPPSGAGAEVRVSRDHYNGPVTIDLTEDGSGDAYTLTLLSSHALNNVGQANLELTDSLFHDDNVISVTGTIGSGNDVISFTPQQNSETLLTHLRNGHPVINEVKVGADAIRHFPVGWIYRRASMPVRPTFGAADRGLFWGELADGTVELRWFGGGQRHDNLLKLFVTGVGYTYVGRRLETNDQILINGKELEIDAPVLQGWDGIDLVFPGDYFGLVFEQDYLPSTHKVNFGPSAVASPDAFVLPKPSVHGEPTYDMSTDKGAYIWKETAGEWRFRVTGGGGPAINYTGTIISDTAFDAVIYRNIEGYNDTITVSSHSIDFDLRVAGPWFDGLDIQVAPDAVLTLQMNNQNNVFVGGQKWPTLPGILTLTDN